MMRKMWVWMVMTMLLAFVNDWNSGCYGCLEEERTGLLDIKAFFDSKGMSETLRDWVDNKEEFGNCCEWSGIQCDDSTKRVIQLSLNDGYTWFGERWMLNASLFLPFKELQSLDLSYTGLVRCFEKEGFEVLSSRLKKLEVLALSSNRLNDSFLPLLKGLSSLKSLDLSYNQLTRSGFEVMSSNLRKLEDLDLSHNQFNDSILSCLSGFSSLKSLNLSRNMLLGSTGINGLRKLEVLYLEHVDFKESTLLLSLGALRSLKMLSLRYNHNLRGIMIGSELNNLTNLEHLFLDKTYLPINFLRNIRGLSALRVLTLTECDINGTLPAQGWCGLKNLEKLHLSNNNLEGSLPPCLGNLTNLEQLDLSGNNLEGSLPPCLGNLKNLEQLDLSGNNLEGSLKGTLPDQGWCELKNLKRLDLSNNTLEGSLPPCLGNLKNLEQLDLSNNTLEGSLPPCLGNLKNLEVLYLSGNNLEGSLPPCLGNMSSLQQLDVSGNQFTGNIAFGPLTNLISLEFLSLSYNHFEVPLSFKSFMNHSSLKFFLCDNNKLIPEPAFPNLIPKFQLLAFSLSNSTSKALNSEIPNFFYSQYDLRFLDLSDNNFSGMFPSWLLKNNTRLEELHLMENSFVGPLQLPNHPNPDITQIDISDNNLHGQIPRNMCLLFPNLRILIMAKNGLIGGIPSCFGNLSSLVYLDLSDNQLSEAKLEQLTTLNFIKLSNNSFGGQISPSLFNSSTLWFLYLGGNNFWGQISDFSPSEGLMVLDLSNNQFSGMLPKWMGNSSLVEAIDFSKNHFEGPIPEEFGKLDFLEYLDLSENNLSGSIPSCFNPPRITHVHLSNNRLSGPLTDAFFNISRLVTLDLSYNKFTGSIPNWIGNLTSLSVLLLKGNHFDGELSAQLCLLEHLSILDVSQNKLSGPLPSCLGNFTLKASPKKPLLVSKLAYEYKSILKIYDATKETYGGVTIDEVIEFTTKKMSYGYKGDILDFMSGFDLSNNRFSGEIPLEMGNLKEIRALNLSHNDLTGSIPATFSNLKQIESLDLSYNNLNGGIPLQLTELTTLEVFSVAHNNLSGKTPERKYQFGTFDESSYEGNPFLCGPPLQNNCSEEQSPSQPTPNDEEEDGGFVDMHVFYVSFGVCYTIVVFAIAAVLYINPHWRRRWFHFAEEFIDSCYVFVVINFQKLSNFKSS